MAKRFDFAVRNLSPLLRRFAWGLAGAVLLSVAALDAQNVSSDRFSPLLKVASANGVQLHYLDTGSGIPIVLIHGGLGDYREWAAEIDSFSQHYRIIDYSRRYNYPNHNPLGAEHSAVVEAKDLAGLLEELKLERVHIVGYSYGALTALFFATQHPERVRSLTLAEPPVFKWLPLIPGGQAQLDHFMTALWKPAGDAFRKEKPETALRITCDYFSGKGSYDTLPAEARAQLWSNVEEWKALTTSRDAFPRLERDAVRELKVPTLLLTGEKTLTAMRLVVNELARLMPQAQRVFIPGATHDMWLQEPAKCGEATLAFLEKH